MATCVYTGPMQCSRVVIGESVCDVGGIKPPNFGCQFQKKSNLIISRSKTQMCQLGLYGRIPDNMQLVLQSGICLTMNAYLVHICLSVHSRVYSDDDMGPIYAYTDNFEVL